VFVADRRRELRAGLAAGGAAACLALLAACGGGGSAPRTLPRLSTTPAAVTSTAPLAGKAAELAAVKAVVRRYYALLNALHKRMDPAPFAALMTSHCVCRAQVNAIREARDRNQHYIDTVRLVSLTAAMETDSRADVLVQYDARRGGLVDAAGRDVTSTRASAGVKRFFILEKTDGHWLIAEIRAA
jgi:hypothetical protein